MVEICEKGSHGGDRLSQLPDHLKCEILIHLSTKDAIRTSVLSMEWRNLWELVPALDLDSNAFSNLASLVSFTERFFDSNKDSWIGKLRLSIDEHVGKSILTRLIDSVTTHKIQHIDVCLNNCYIFGELPPLPLSMFTCETLVHLRLYWVILMNAEFVSLPCLKIIHLENIIYPNEATLEKLILGSPVLEDLTLIRPAYNDAPKVLHVRSQTLKRIDINECTQVVIYAPLLECLRTKVYLKKNFQFISSCFPAKIDIHLLYICERSSESVIGHILTEISRVRDLVISRNTCKEIILYSKSRPMLQFCYLSRLNARFHNSDLAMLPTLLESCPKLESFILDLTKPRKKKKKKKKKKEPKDQLSTLDLSTVPRCLVSSLKFVVLKHSISGYHGEIQLVRYFLKNSRILEKLKLDVYYTKNGKDCFLKKVCAMPRSSNTCEVLVL